IRPSSPDGLPIRPTFPAAWPSLAYSHTPRGRGRLAAAREKLRAPDMKQFTIVVKPFRAEAVLRAVGELNVTACVVQEAKGYGRQKGYLDRYAGGEYSLAYLPKVEITIWVSDDRADAVADN